MEQLLILLIAMQTQPIVFMSNHASQDRGSTSAFNAIHGSHSTETGNSQLNDPNFHSIYAIILNDKAHFIINNQCSLLFICQKKSKRMT